MMIEDFWIKSKQSRVNGLMWFQMPKMKLTVTVTPEIMKWVDEEVEKSFFANRSHAVEYSLKKVRKLIKNGEIKF